MNLQNNPTNGRDFIILAIYALFKGVSDLTDKATLEAAEGVLELYDEGRLDEVLEQVNKMVRQ